MRVYHLRDRIILASLISVIPFLVLNLILQLSRVRDNRRAAMYSHEVIASHIVDGYTGYLNNLVTFERSAGFALWNDHSIPGSRQSGYLDSITENNNAILHTAAIDPYGRIVASDIPAMIGMDMKRHPSVQKVLHGASCTVSDVSSINHIPGPIVMVNVGIRNKADNTEGMIVAFLDQKCVRSVLKRDITIDLRSSAEVIITDSKGIVFIARGPMKIDSKKCNWSKYPFIQGALAGKESKINDFEIASRRKVLGVSKPIGNLGWTVSVFTPVNEIVGGVNKSVLLNTLAILFFSGITVTLAFFTGNRLSTPIIRLSDTARSFGQGNLHARASTGTGDELDILASSFNEMASVLQRQTEQLNDALAKESKERHRASALYLIAQGLVINVHLNARLEVISQALASICEVKRCAIFLRRADRLVGVSGWGLSNPQDFPGMDLDIGGRFGLVHDSLIAGIPIFIPDTAADPRVPEEMLEIYNIRGLLALPIVRRKHLVGLAILDNPSEYAHFDNEAINTARGLATLAAIAIENAESHEKWVKIAEAFQGAMLPDIPARVGSFDMSCRYYAAMEMAELGGDFYDIIMMPDGRIGLVIADVSGKGLEAAIFTAMGKYTIRAFAAENPEPASVLTRANKAISDEAGQMGFLTVFYGLLDPDTGRLIYGNAGHPPPLVMRDGDDQIWLSGETRQPPMGVMSDLEYQQWEFQIEPSDILTCYTDGVIEARRNGDMFDMERLAAVVQNERDRRPVDITSAIHKAVVDFSHGKIQDDIAILVIERKIAQDLSDI